LDKARREEIKGAMEAQLDKYEVEPHPYYVKIRKRKDDHYYSLVMGFELITDLEKAEVKIERLRELLRTAQKLISPTGLDSEEGFYRFRDDLEATLGG